MDCPNATPLNPGEYYLVDEYVYIYSSGSYYSTMNCALVFMDFGGNCESIATPLSNYFMKRLPAIGKKYTKSSGSNPFFGGTEDYVPLT